MKVAVTLATGKLGNAIVSELKKHIGAENIVGVARSPEKGKHLNIEMREGDYDNSEHFVAAFKGIDVVICISGLALPEDRVQQHRNVIEGAKTNGVKKFIYTSICGTPDETGFAPVVKSNRQTEQDIIASGLPFAIGRNGIYLNEDLVYMDKYKALGKVMNCAGKGLCAYTSREELAVAYANLASSTTAENAVFHLVGEGISQQVLTQKLNHYFHTELTFENVDAATYLEDRLSELGDYFGPIIAGIYDSIAKGYFNPKSDFESVVGRRHLSVDEMIAAFLEASA